MSCDTRTPKLNPRFAVTILIGAGVFRGGWCLTTQFLLALAAGLAVLSIQVSRSCVFHRGLTE